MQPDIEYRDIPGFPGYKVGTDGTLWSRRQGDKWRQLRGSRLRTGYRIAGLRTSTGSKHLCFHQLVLLAFVGPCPPGQQTRHLNNDPSDNRLRNLCYGTPQENQADKDRKFISRLPLIHEIREMVTAGVPVPRIVHEKKVTRKFIGDALCLTSGRSASNSVRYR